MTDEDRFVLPPLTSRSWWRWITATLVAVVAVAAYVWATQPQDRWAVAAVAVLGAVLVLAVARRAAWVEVSTGTVVKRTLLRGRQRMPLAEAAVEVRANGGGLATLDVSAGRGRTVRLPLLALTQYVERSQEAAPLRTLADLVERWSGERGRTAVDLMRRQADHVAAGGSATTSPLAPLARKNITGAVGAAGAAGGATDLLP
ncbi:hypothetical protein EV189_0038 [Motilibacter rhizosphaerae]|uniref:PH (Pleckstrin Homology) domain-containing protein n=1 Tax=Motilibacter rhizosphaerae TaxID=598652 RepID=A0A4V2F4X2_9ACTN|nr:hypothetical protein [Motilibacter rhizosphaerae]RZS90809.1 hypothetical protein EV189_0038 [Motilibacter rhizosphaerae]